MTELPFGFQPDDSGEPNPLASLFGAAGSQDLGAMFSQLGRMLSNPVEGPVHWELARDTARQAPSAVGYPSVTPTETTATVEALRLAELWTARREGHWIRVVQSKAKRRMVPIHTRIAGCAIPPTVSRAEFRADWDRARLECGRPDLWARDLRHVCATMLVLAGVDLASVRDWLGHANLAVTSKYANLQPEHLRAAAGRLL